MRISASLHHGINSSQAPFHLRLLFNTRVITTVWAFLHRNVVCFVLATTAVATQSLDIRPPCCLSDPTCPLHPGLSATNSHSDSLLQVTTTLQSRSDEGHLAESSWHVWWRSRNKMVNLRSAHCTLKIRVCYLCTLWCKTLKPSRLWFQCHNTSYRVSTLSRSNHLLNHAFVFHVLQSY